MSSADLVTISGRDSLTFPRLATRVFNGLHLEDVTTLMVTQSSADNVLCFAIHSADLAKVRARLEKTFELEMLHEYVGALDVMPKIAIIVALGENMKGTPGLAGRAFSALGKKAINIIAIAQGSTELSISFAVKSADVKDAVKAIHDEFQL